MESYMKVATLDLTKDLFLKDKINNWANVNVEINASNWFNEFEPESQSNEDKMHETSNEGTEGFRKRKRRRPKKLIVKKEQSSADEQIQPLIANIIDDPERMNRGRIISCMCAAWSVERSAPIRDVAVLCRAQLREPPLLCCASY
ncbi:hypothetical protein TSAR_011232, partial [Trichomalopsis sarcophagae]